MEKFPYAFITGLALLSSLILLPQAFGAGETLSLSRVDEIARKELTIRQGESGETERFIAIVTLHGRYHILPSTQVVDKKGKPLTMDSLIVPCKAEIFYQPLSRNDPNAVKVVFLQALKRGNTAWTISDPE